MKKPLWFNLVFILLILVVVIPMLFPLYWMLVSAFRLQVDIIQWPPRFFFTPTLRNFERVFGEQNFLLYLENSAIVGIGAVLVSLVIGLPAAYSIARFRQRRLLMLILVARVMPGICFLLPWFIIFSRLRLMDTFIALTLSHILIILPVVVWVVSAYIETIPVELEDSAMVDGATRQRAFLSIILPLSMPGVITATTLSFIFSWNNFMFAQVLSMARTRTLPIAIFNFMGYAEIDWGGVMASAVTIITPAIILTMFFQKYVIKGLTVGAVKG